MDRSNPPHPPAGRAQPETGSFLDRLGAWRSGALSAEPAASQPVGRGQGKRLVITVTRKGGVGKSFFLASLADWYAERRVPIAALDCDWCNGTLTRFLPSARFVDVAAGNPGEDVNDALSGNDIVLMDGFGPLQAYVFDWLGENRFFQEFGVPVAVTYVVMIEEDKDSVFQAGEAFRALGSTGDWLVVRNLKVCPTTEIYNASDIRQELLRQGASEIQMDRIPWNLLLHVQRAGKTLRALAEETSLPFLERQRMNSFCAKFYEQLNGVQHLLLPAHAVRPPAPPEPPPPAPSAPRPASRPEPPPPKSRPRIAPERV